MVSNDEKRPIDDSRFGELAPGKLLVWARERAGLTQEQVAKELYMTLTKVRALESDDYRHMGADTFTRGYLRAYASLVKLDVTQVLAAYDRHAQRHGLIEEVLPRRVESANKPLWQFIAIVLFALLVLWLASIWFFDNRQQPKYDRPIAVVPPVETALSVQMINTSSAAQSSASSEEAVSLVVQSNSSTGYSSVAASLPASIINGVSVPEQQVSANVVDTISFSFKEECWLEVSDASGDVLIADLREAGSDFDLKGKAPFDVKLGNAPAVSVKLNGKSIPIVPALGTNVLSIKVGALAHE